MDAGAKANIRGGAEDLFRFSPDARLLDGAPLGPDSAGIVFDSGRTISLARAAMVPGNELLVPDNQGGWQVNRRRTGAVSWLKADKQIPTTHGAELEYSRCNPDGSYGSFDVTEQNDINELYSMMGESSTERPTDDPRELERFLYDMVGQIVAKAENAGQFAVATGTFGHAEPGEEHMSASEYVQHIRGLMTGRSGFDTLQAFRTMGFQPHVGVSNSEAGIKAAEAMQYLNPILMAPTLSAPHTLGGLVDKLLSENPDFTEKQLQHMAKFGFDSQALKGQVQSWRYGLRVLGSPSAGIWQEPAPDGEDAYLRRAHEQLAAGDIASIDRTNGWHADRMRLVLDGKGANTLEGCAYDPMLGNVKTLFPLQMLHAALVTALEKMALHGKDPREYVAGMLNIAHLSREERLVGAHVLSMGEVSKYGNDAVVYGQTPRLWLDSLLNLAKGADYVKVDEDLEQRLRKMFVGQAATAIAMKKWCKENNADHPTAQAYFDLGMGSPSYYMRAHAHALRKKDSGRPRDSRRSEEQIVRLVELKAGEALHRSVGGLSLANAA